MKVPIVVSYPVPPDFKIHEETTFHEIDFNKMERSKHIDLCNCCGKEISLGLVTCTKCNEDLSQFHEIRESFERNPPIGWSEDIEWLISQLAERFYKGEK